MSEEDFSSQLDDYLTPPSDPNPKMRDVEIVWVRNNPALGSLHMLVEHQVTEKEVEQALLEIPPWVEARPHPYVPNRTLFWGATRLDRWLFIVCEDWKVGKRRLLKPITAFEPAEGTAYWENYK